MFATFIEYQAGSEEMEDAEFICSYLLKRLYFHFLFSRLFSNNSNFRYATEQENLA